MNPGCLLTGILSLAPRLVLLFVWLFSDRIGTVFEGFLIPLLGFIFLPFTTLAYLLVWNAQSGVSGAAWLLVAGGLLFDIGTYALSGYANRLRIYTSEGGA
ncbi:MAG: hypothetical protein WA997_03500 [Anaerolineales bacterium]|nr:hypothetical protein [Anaerolineales bacterium]